MNVGYLCTYTPKELIDAAGFTPIRIFAKDNPITLAHIYKVMPVPKQGEVLKEL